MALQHTSYTSAPVQLPADFLASPTHVTLTPIPFSTSIPEYAPHTALLLDNVLSPAECRQLIALAELSSPWKPALIAVGPNLEAAAPDYRNSDRIIWDRQDVVDLIWQRCLQAEGLAEILADPPSPGKWRFRCLNERMRFLKYSPGGFFKPHQDSHYSAIMDNERVETHYTLHLYLNHEGLEGGATSFLSRDKTRRHDVNPKSGSVLIFQHNHLLHEGALVTAGTKYTMRTDLLYTAIP